MATIVEKIFEKKIGHPVRPGDILVVDVDACMIHDVNGPATLKYFSEISEKVKSPEKCLIALDHFAPSPNAKFSTQHMLLRQFAKTQGIDLVEVCKGVCHQSMVESGKIMPGMIAVATDSHTCSYGVLNLFSTGVGAAEAAIVFASNQCWFRVPETIRVDFYGELPKDVYGKDIALEILRQIGAGGANYKCIEFGGESISQLSFDSRMTICNMAAEIGAKGAIMPYDEVTQQWMDEHGINRGDPVCADHDAEYAERIRINLSALSPMVSIPHEICDVVPVISLNTIPVDKVFIGTCTNGRYEDIKLAASVLKGKAIHPDVRLMIIPASAYIERKLRKEGIMEILEDAGASIFPSCCGPCAGIHMGLLGENEVVLSTSNRNSAGRMGSKTAQIYISSPLVAAYTALKGYISDGRC